MNRRTFIQTAAGAVAVGPGTWLLGGPALGAPTLAPKPGADDGEVVFRSSFEEGDPMPPDLSAHQVVADRARTGKRSLVAEVTEANKAVFLEIPFEAPAGRVLRVSFWARSERGSAAAVFLRVGRQRISLGRTDKVPARTWKHVEASWTATKPTRGVVQIVAPSSYKASPGRMWIDDVSVTLHKETLAWPECVNDFPAVASADGCIWMAALERPEPRGVIRVYRLDGAEPKVVATLDAKGATAIGTPAIAAMPTDDNTQACLVAFPVEQNGRWRIAYGAGSDRENWKPWCEVLDCRGSANTNPAVANVPSVWMILWESNADGCRRIHAGRLGWQGRDHIEAISAPGANSNNPAVVALEDGSLFAAWDSFRDGSADIYGAVWRDGQWGKERRLTSDPRIERHPHLAARGNEVWMAWQAQSYPKNKINYVNEQRICVARVDGDRLMAPKGHAEHVVGATGCFLRPRVTFDPEGRLWLSARRSLGQHGGWEALAWCCGGDRWTGPTRLLGTYGRWRPVPLVWGKGGGRAVVQFDDLPDAWREQGIRPDWKSGVAVCALPAEDLPPAQPPQVEPLAMPATDFSLPQKRDLVAADLPRESVAHGGANLTLYWGDFHDHTDLSVCQREANPPGHDLLANERDIERLDFVAITDHGYNFDPPQWAFHGAQVRANHDPGRFVTFLAEEWTSDHIPYRPPRHGTEVGSGKRVALRRYGHRNLIFLDPFGERFFDSRDGDIPPGKVWSQFEPGQVIAIPHQLADLGNRPTDWTQHDPRYQPVAEIWQTRGSYEHAGCPRQAGRSMQEPGRYLQDAWARGLIIGVIASPDHGGGAGKVGAWAEDLTREALFRAVLARHTFGTSGPKMVLLLRSGEAMMGDVVPRPAGALAFSVRARAARPIRELVLFRNNEVVHRAEPGKVEVDLAWTDEAPPAGAKPASAGVKSGSADASQDADPLPDVPLRLWYYARIQCTDDELAWTSPIWFEG